MARPALPRGSEGAFASSTAATSAWATPADLSRFKSAETGFYLGTDMRVPEVAEPLKAKLESLIDDLSNAHAIRADWRAHHIALARAHLANIHCLPQLIGIDNDMHVITVAGTRGGKGTTTIIPNLIRYPGSVICIDPKGENARITAARRGQGDAHCHGMGQRVHVLDPYRVSGISDDRLACYNPLDFVDVESDGLYDQAASVTEALTIRSEGNGENRHFDDAASTLIKGLILYTKIMRGNGDCNLLTVRRLLTEGIRAEPDHDRHIEPADFSPTRALLSRMERTEDPAGAISACAAMLLDMGDREFGSVLSTARRQLEFIEKVPIARTLERSTFSLDELKTAPEGATVYLCLPPQHMQSAGRWLRLMIGLTMERMYVLPTPSRPPVLFILEEFHTLGHMPVIETGIAYAAGFGIKYQVVLQDLTQLRRHYPKSWETFIANAGVLQVFANCDTTTLDYVSKRLGDIEITQSTASASTSQTVTSADASAHDRMQALFQNRGPLSALINPLTATADYSKSSTGYNSTTSKNDAPKATRLARPEEIERAFRRDAMAALVVIAGEPPMALSRLNYYDAAPFAGQFTPGDNATSKTSIADPIAAAENFERLTRSAITAALAARITA